MKKFISLLTMLAVVVCLFPTTVKAAAVTRSITVERHFDEAFKVVTLVNQERAKYGLNPLSLDADLFDAAMLRAAESAVLFEHTRPDGSSCFTTSSKMFGENIAYGYNMIYTAQDAVTGWMNSPGHRANILTPGFTIIGVGYVSIGNQNFWSQAFGYDKGVSLSQPKNDSYTYSFKVDEAFVKSSGGSLDLLNKNNAITTPSITGTEKNIEEEMKRVQEFLDKGIAVRVIDPDGEHYYLVDKNDIEKHLKNNAKHETDEKNSFRFSYTKTNVFDKAVYRMYRQGIGYHFAFEKEKNDILKMAPGLWTIDNGGNPYFYASSNTSGQKVYRLYQPKLGVHHLATKLERDSIMKSGLWKDETNDLNSWYTP